MRSPRRSCAWVLGFALAIACSGVGACARERAKSEAKQRVFAPPPPPAEQLLAQQPLDASALARDPAVRDRILHMTLGELALRLGSAQFRGEESVTFSRGDLKRKQVTRARVRQNKAGSFAVDVEMEGGDQQHLVYHDGVLYVRHNVGHWRTSRDPTEERVRWREQAYGLWSAVEDLVRGSLRVSEGRPVQHQGRDALRFDLVIGPGQAPEGPMPAEMIAVDAGLGPVELARREAGRVEQWRRHAVTEGGGGTLVVDRATGVVLEVEVSFSLRVEDEPDQAARAELSLRAGLEKIGEEPEIGAPEDFISEFSRRKIVTRPLSFLDGGTPAPVPAPAPADDEQVEE